MLQLRRDKGKIDVAGNVLGMAKLDLEDEVVLCGGLRSAGTRPLSSEERDGVLYRLRSQRKVMILSFLAIPFCLALPFILWGLLNSAFAEPGSIEDIVAIVAIVSVIIGIPASIYFADLALKRYRVLKRTVSANHVRLFAGTLDDEDSTNDHAQSILRQAARMKSDDDQEVRVDLYAGGDVLFKINDREPTRWIELTLTRAVRPPSSPARFRAPIALPDSETRDDILRRRLTAGELDEIRGYATQMRRRRWWLTIAAAWMLGVLTRTVGIKLFDLEFAVIFAFWVGISAIVCGGLFYYLTSNAGLYIQDREYGWAIILEPEHVSALSDGERTLTHSIEILPVSGVTWTIGGNPAGWRRRA